MQAKANLDEVPVVGAEIFIEPGQTPAEIDGWFRIMKENGMLLTRIRMFENYMHLPDDSWDFTLFDEAFKAGEKYGIKIYGNLFPATDFTDVGGFKFPHSDEHLQSIANYIKHLVPHFKQFTSLYGWVPVNEPGNEGLPVDAFTQKQFAAWKAKQQNPNYNSNNYTTLDFAAERFLVDYNTWFLQWLSDEIQRYDPRCRIHVNNHNIFQNAAEYDFPAWRNFLTSLGGSAHASWHFKYFTRQQYAMALSANSEMLRSGAGDIPWLMTELQGGNNTYSAFEPLCPTKEEIAQWIWTTVATGSKGAVFWCLNPRSSGFEAGEWAMVDFQDKPSDRLIAAGEIATIIHENSPLFSKAKVVESGITILYSRESLWIEKKLQIAGTDYEGRSVGGVMKSALAYFEALTQMGLQCSFREMGEYDFTADDYRDKVLILAHQVSVPSRYWKGLEDFVAKGGKLMVEGLTAYYDENAYCLLRIFPLQKLFGGNIKEFKLLNPLFQTEIKTLTLPTHLWQGTVLPTTAVVQAANSNNDPIAMHHTFGKGEVLWIPSLLGLGGRISGNYEPLAQLLKPVVETNKNAAPVTFNTLQPHLLLKTLQSGNTYITCIVNKHTEKQSIDLQLQNGLQFSQILFANKGGTYNHNTVEIAAEETMVLQFDAVSK